MSKINKILLICSIFMIFMSSACDHPPTESQKSQNEAINKASRRSAYVQKSDIEFNNYDKRQRLADDPSVILWCTSAFPIPSSPLFTVPIVGKLTSGNKRPFPTQQNRMGEVGWYYPELPGPDGMYGSSGEYRFGFTPAGVYADWYGMPCFCTTEPMVWQRQKTEIVMQADPELLKAHELAKQALQKGDAKEANAILEKSINLLKKEKNDEK